MGLYLAVIPVRDLDDTCHRFTLARPDGKHLTWTDLNNVRRAFGQETLDEQPSWMES